jgi:hypothetical protein
MLNRRTARYKWYGSDFRSIIETIIRSAKQLMGTFRVVMYLGIEGLPWRNEENVPWNEPQESLYLTWCYRADMQFPDI